MSKKYAVRPVASSFDVSPSSPNLYRELGGKIVSKLSVRKSVAAVSIMLVATLAASMSASAKSISQCTKEYRSCHQACNKWQPGGDMYRSCKSRCANAYLNCGPGSPPKKNAPTDPVQPRPPKGTENHTPPTGGTKGNPKSPPKVNDTRAPLGDVFGRPTQRAPGASAPILLRSVGLRR